MDYKAKIEQITSIARASERPIPLLLDLMRMKQSDYVAECLGLRFELNAGRFEWFTLLENVIREDYFRDGISLREGDLVIDIGANFGSFTALASRKVGTSGKVVAIEPNPDVFARLQRNVTINRLTNVETRNEAVSGRDGASDLHMHRRNAFTTLVASVDRRDNTDTRSVRVKTSSLPSIVASLGGEVALLKIDCEGAEYEILDSLDEATASCIRQITMEAHHIPDRRMSDIPPRLRELGFQVNENFPMVTAFRNRN